MLPLSLSDAAKVPEEGRHEETGKNYFALFCIQHAGTEQLLCARHSSWGWEHSGDPPLTHVSTGCRPPSLSMPSDGLVESSENRMGHQMPRREEWTQGGGL